MKPRQLNWAVKGDIYQFVADFLGEAIVFGIAGSVLIADASRNAVAESNRRKAIEEKFDSLFAQMEALSERLEMLSAKEST